jgi:hypothetical protein
MQLFFDVRLKKVDHWSTVWCQFLDPLGCALIDRMFVMVETDKTGGTYSLEISPDSRPGFAGDRIDPTAFAVGTGGFWKEPKSDFSGFVGVVWGAAPRSVTARVALNVLRDATVLFKAGNGKQTSCENANLNRQPFRHDVVFGKLGYGVVHEATKGQHLLGHWCRVCEEVGLRWRVLDAQGMDQNFSFFSNDNQRSESLTSTAGPLSLWLTGY